MEILIEILKSQNFPYLVLIIFIAIFFFFLFSFYKIKRMMDIDEKVKIYYENGNLKQEGRGRDRWDYNIFGGLTRMWHKSEWQEFIGIVLLTVFLVIYLLKNDPAFLQLININVGVIFGMQVNKYLNNK